MNTCAVSKPEKRNFIPIFHFFISIHCIDIIILPCFFVEAPNVNCFLQSLFFFLLHLNFYLNSFYFIGHNKPKWFRLSFLYQMMFVIHNCKIIELKLADACNEVPPVSKSKSIRERTTKSTVKCSEYRTKQKQHTTSSIAVIVVAIIVNVFNCKRVFSLSS